MKKLNSKGFTHGIGLMAVVVLTSIVGVAYLVQSRAATPAPLISEDFTSSAKNFVPQRGGTWSVKSGQYVLSNPAPIYRDGNGNISVHKTIVTVDSYTMVVEGSTPAVAASDFDDFSVISSYVNADNYVYVNLSESNNATANGIFKVVNGVATQIADFTVTSSPGIQYGVKLVKTGQTLKVYRNSTFMGSATDASIKNGQVGVGAYNNNASFDNLVVQALDTPTPPPPPPPAGKILWKADAEDLMTSEWASNSSVPLAASPPAPDPTRINRNDFRAQGLKSYRFEIRYGDDSYGARAELGQASPVRADYPDHLFRGGEERWISMQYFLPQTWPKDNTWMTIMQIKPITGGGGGPDIGIDAGSNRFTFYGNTNAWGSTDGKIFDGKGPLTAGGYALPTGHWVKLTWHIIFSADPTIGAFETFGDLGDGNGMRTLVPFHKRATMKYLDGVMDPVQLRVGIYRDPAITTTAYSFVDGVTVATSREAAEVNAFRAAQ